MVGDVHQRPQLTAGQIINDILFPEVQSVAIQGRRSCSGQVCHGRCTFFDDRNNIHCLATPAEVWLTKSLDNAPLSHV